jgi:hypothetical protein
MVYLGRFLTSSKIRSTYKPKIPTLIKILPERKLNKTTIVGSPTGKFDVRRVEKMYPTPNKIERRETANPVTRLKRSKTFE